MKLILGLLVSLTSFAAFASAGEICASLNNGMSVGALCARAQSTPQLPEKIVLCVQGHQKELVSVDGAAVSHAEVQNDVLTAEREVITANGLSLIFGAQHSGPKFLAYVKLVVDSGVSYSSHYVCSAP